MLGRSHILHGTSAGAWTAYGAAHVGVPRDIALVVAAGVVVGSITPDIDSKHSMITYSLGPVTIILSWIVRLFVEHRGFTHRPEGWLTTGAITAVAVYTAGKGFAPYALVIGAGMTIGCATHTWGDCRTTSGVRIAGKDRHLGRTFSTGSDAELIRRYRIYAPFAIASVLGSTYLTLT